MTIATNGQMTGSVTVTVGGSGTGTVTGTIQNSGAVNGRVQYPGEPFSTITGTLVADANGNLTGTLVQSFEGNSWAVTFVLNKQ